MILSTGKREKKKDIYLLDALKPQNLGAYMCAARKADIHICLCALSSVGTRVSACVCTGGCCVHKCAWKDELGPEKRPLKRVARLELEGLNYFWLTWKIRSNHYEGLQICPIIISDKPSIYWEELQQSRREAVDSVMLNGGVEDNRKVTKTTDDGGGKLEQEFWAEL